MALKWIVSVAAGLALVVYTGGYRAVGPELFDALEQFAFAAAFVALHVVLWRGKGRLFSILRGAVWLAYGASLAMFLVAYFPRGVIPVAALLVSNITLPMALGFLAMALPARLRGWRPAMQPAAPASTLR